jgi:two-component system chemotaxis response regulator CheB
MRDLVVIGGTLTGLKRLCRLIDQLPSSFQAPILAELHALPERPESPVELLAACTSLPVGYGTAGTRPRAGRVYLAPADRHLVVMPSGALDLCGDHRPDAAADHLFASAARACGPRVIGAVLAGGGLDGLEGLGAINAAGGIGILEATQEAFHPEPVGGSHARHTTQAHYCLPLDDIAELLRKLIDGDESMGQALG